MQADNFFEWIGEQLGQAIRLIVDSLNWLFGHFYGAIDSFIQGLTGALGISASFLSLAILVIGLALLAEALRMLIRRRFIAALIWLLIGLVTLSWLIH